MGRGTRRGAGGRREGSTWARRISAFFGIVTALILAAAISGVIFVGVRLRRAVKDLPSVEILTRESLGGTIQVYSTDNVLLGEIINTYRAHVDFKDIPKPLVEATIAIEDERFYDHPGVDFKGVARALYKNAREGKNSEGASTLTQQLVKNVILKDFRKTIDRKVQEAVLAYQVERMFTKDQILERYLNEVNYGGQIYGVKMAAKLYFGKELKDLSISECALLAGIVQRPSAFDPYRHKEASLDRRDTVLTKMAELGFITSTELTTEKKRNINVRSEPPRIALKPKAPFFFNYVLRQLYSKYKNNKVVLERGGVKVYTTLNYKMQQKAEELLAREVKANRSQSVSEGALVCMEPHTGWIRTMVGSVDFAKDEYNFAAQGGRQPGSTFKPIVYAVAFESGKYGPDTELRDSSLRLSRNKLWPRNYGGSYGSGAEISIIEAVARSRNTIPAYLTQQLGWKKVVEMAHRLGIKSDFPKNDLSIALGSSPATPLEMVTVYSVFANGGDRVEPMAIRLIRDADGNTLEENAPTIQKSVLTQTTAANIGRCLEAVVDHGSGTAAKIVDGARGKTGTTSDNKDAWFIGYTKELVTAIWVANKQVITQKNKKTGEVKTYVSYKRMDSDVTGGHLCTPIWAKFMLEAVPIQQSAGLEQIPLPDTVEGRRLAAIRAGMVAKKTTEPTPKPERRKKRRSDAATPEPDATPVPDEAPTTDTATETTADETESVAICEESSKRANAYCTEVVTKSFPKGTKIPLCRIHHAPGEEDAPGGDN